MLTVVNNAFGRFIALADLRKRPFMASIIDEKLFQSKVRNRVNRLLASYRRVTQSPVPKKLRIEDNILDNNNRDPLQTAREKLQNAITEAMQLLEPQ